jgi:hypothetical protein
LMSPITLVGVINAGGLNRMYQNTCDSKYSSL